MPAMFPSFARPLLFAHRGASQLAPENTLEAFELAVRLGAHVLELDVHLSRDGEVVVLHDALLERTTNGHGPVADATYLQLARLDAGHHFHIAGAHPFRGRGVTLPRLEDVLRSFSGCGFNIEVKAPGAPMLRAVAKVLERCGCNDVLLAAGHDGIMRDLEAADLGCSLGLSRRQVLRAVWGAWGGGMPAHFTGRALQIPPSSWGLPLATHRTMRAARAAGIEVHVWTLNTPAAATRYLQRGADGIMSDDPGALGHLFDVSRSAKRRRGEPA